MTMEPNSTCADLAAPLPRLVGGGPALPAGTGSTGMPWPGPRDGSTTVGRPSPAATITCSRPAMLSTSSPSWLWQKDPFWIDCLEQAPDCETSEKGSSLTVNSTRFHQRLRFGSTYWHL